MKVGWGRNKVVETITYGDWKIEVVYSKWKRWDYQATNAKGDKIHRVDFRTKNIAIEDAKKEIFRAERVLVTI
jgi:hypothetical protein